MIWAIILIIAGYLFLATPALAVSITASNIPSSITDQSFTINVSISGAFAGINYLRVDLYKDTTTNYFGETYNNSSWYNGSDGKQYFPITIISGQTWSSTVQARVGNPSSTDYPGSGAYKLKIRRYTSSGSQSSGDTQTPQDVTISLTSYTPSPAATPSTSFSISNVPTKINSTQTITPSISLNLPDSHNTKFYLKGAFKKVDTSNYFGLTKVGSAWIKNGSSYSDQLAITTDSSGAWSGNMEVQVDPFDSGYDGSGDYIFKVGRYSESGSGPTWSNEVNIKINSSEVSGGDEVDNLFHKTSSSQNSSTKDTPSGASHYDSLVYHSASVAAATISPTTSPSKIAGQKQFNLLIPIIGVGLLFIGIGVLVFIYLQR